MQKSVEILERKFTRDETLHGVLGMERYSLQACGMTIVKLWNTLRLYIVTSD